MIAKKFSKFYINQFVPLSKLEETDVTRSRNFYRTAIIVGAVSGGFLSFKMRAMRYNLMKAEEAPRDLNLPLNILNDATVGIVGFFMGHLVGCDYIYKHRQYVHMRLCYESKANMTRRKEDQIRDYEGQLPDEYPFRDFTSEYMFMSDSDIIGDRMRPQEMA